MKIQVFEILAAIRKKQHFTNKKASELTYLGVNVMKFWQYSEKNEDKHSKKFKGIKPDCEKSNSKETHETNLK